MDVERSKYTQNNKDGVDGTGNHTFSLESSSNSSSKAWITTMLASSDIRYGFAWLMT